MGIPGFFEQVRSLQTRQANVVGQAFTDYRDCLRALDAEFGDAAAWKAATPAQVQAHRDRALAALAVLTRETIELRSAAYHVGELGERDHLPMPDLGLVIALGSELLLQLAALATARGPETGWPSPGSAAMGAQHFGQTHREALLWIQSHLVESGSGR